MIDPQRQRLIALAQRNLPDDPAVAAAWYRLIEAMEAGWLTASNLGAVIDLVERGVGWGVQEVSIDPEGDEAVVSFVNFEERCDLAALIAALRRLQAATEGGPMRDAGAEIGREAARSTALAPGLDLQTPEGLRALVAHIVGMSGASSLTPTAPVPAELREVVAVAETLSRRLAAGGDLSDLRGLASVGDITDDLRARVEALTPRLEALVKRRGEGAVQEGLDALRRWQAGDPSAGAAVDAWIHELEAAGSGIVGPDPAVRDAERQTALRAEARSAITASLKARGFPPTR